MIVKNLTRKKGSAQLLRYILRYTLKEQNQTNPLVIRHNIKSRTVEGYIKDFKENEARRVNKRKDQIVINHVILSWNHKDSDKVSDHVLTQVAKQFIQLRGINNLYVISKHTDRKHIHLHIAMSATRLNGYSNRLTKAEFAQLKIKLDAFQQLHFPELANSLPNHGMSKHPNKDKGIWQNGRLSEKQILQKTLDDIFKESKSSDDFIVRLKARGHQPYYRGTENKLAGIKYNGDRKFRLRSFGYLPEKIAVLDNQISKMDKELLEIQNIRKAKMKEKEIERSYYLAQRGLGNAPQDACHKIF